MRRISGGVLALALAAGLVAAQDKPRDAPSPQEQYKALLKEWQEGITAYSKAAREAKTPEERQKLFRQRAEHLEKLAPKFAALAEKHPRDPVAVNAVLWVLNNTRGTGATNEAREKAVDLVIRHHIDQENLGPVCLRLQFTTDNASLKLLRAVLEKSPHKAVQGQACLALAQRLKNSSRSADSARATKEIEALLERAAKDFADVKLPLRGTVGDKAKQELYEIRHLAIGKVAPDVEGQDQDGKQFKLRDYRGKVVFLDFWQRG